MQALSQTFTLGRAFIVEGAADVIDAVRHAVERDGFLTTGGDAYVRAYQQFGIDDARAIGEKAAARAIGSGRVFIISFASASAEAQNALLKTLEDTQRALFVIIVPAAGELLATVRSRCEFLRLPIGAAELPSVDAFMAADAAGRLAIVESFLGKDRRDLGEIITFLSSLERSLSREAPSRMRDDALRALYRARAYAGDKGALLKPLLEQVALLS